MKNPFAALIQEAAVAQSMRPSLAPADVPWADVEIDEAEPLDSKELGFDEAFTPAPQPLPEPPKDVRALGLRPPPLPPKQGRLAPLQGSPAVPIEPAPEPKTARPRDPSTSSVVTVSAAVVPGEPPRRISVTPAPPPPEAQPSEQVVWPRSITTDEKRARFRFASVPAKIPDWELDAFRTSLGLLLRGAGIREKTELPAWLGKRGPQAEPTPPIDPNAGGPIALPGPAAARAVAAAVSPGGAEARAVAPPAVSAPARAMTPRAASRPASAARAATPAPAAVSPAPPAPAPRAVTAAPSAAARAATTAPEVPLAAAPEVEAPPAAAEPHSPEPVLKEAPEPVRRFEGPRARTGVAKEKSSGARGVSRSEPTETKAPAETLDMSAFTFGRRRAKGREDSGYIYVSGKAVEGVLEGTTPATDATVNPAQAKAPEPAPAAAPKEEARPRGRKNRPHLPPKGDIVLGIDLGTTYSCAAVVEKGKPRVIASRWGTRTIPSAVMFGEGGKTVVGDAALRQLPVNPKHTIVGAKRFIGRPYNSPVVQRLRDNFAYDLVEGDEGEVAIRIRSETFSLEEVSALILKEIRESASLQLQGRVNRAVITCPAYYTDRQRDAVRVAGELAGFHVERVLAEPTAAALNYGFGKGLENRKVLVYDLGGGTFDASLLEIDGDVYEVRATGGDTFLGGIDFDACIAGLVAQAILERNNVDAREDEMAVARLLQFAEQAKRELSERESTEIRIDHFVVAGYAAFPVQVRIKRSDVEPMYDALIEKTLDIVKEVAGRVGMSPEDVDDIILVGGQTRTPLVQQKVRALFKKDPKKNVHPDEAVALGAAQYAASLGSKDSILLIDSLPMSIGIGLPGGRMRKVVERDTTLPVVRAHTIRTTRDDQTGFEVLVFQGEDDTNVLNDEPLGLLVIADLPKGPKGTIAVEISFSVNGECILELSAKELSTGKTVRSKFGTKGTPQDIRESLGLSGKLSHEVLKKQAESAQKRLNAAEQAASKTGVWGWLTGAFRKKR